MNENGNREMMKKKKREKKEEEDIISVFVLALITFSEVLQHPLPSPLGLSHQRRF